MARILVVDDDENVRKYIAVALKREGHEIAMACDGVEALGVFCKDDFDLVILDIIMPEKEGIETLIDMRLENPGIKIIAISGGGRVGPESYLLTARELGAVKAIEKPFSTEKLIEEVSTALSM